MIPQAVIALWQVAHDIFTREGEYALALGIVDNLNAHYFGYRFHSQEGQITSRLSESHFRLRKPTIFWMPLSRWLQLAGNKISLN